MFHYRPTREVLELLGSFRRMVNEAISIGLERRPQTRFQLIAMVYENFKDYGLHTHYILNACEVAFSILRNHRRRNRPPYAKRPFLKLDSQTYKLDYLLLRIPAGPRKFIFIALKAGEYQAGFLRDATLKRGSITITARGTVSLIFNKNVSPMEPLGKIGLDINEGSIVGFSDDGSTSKHDLRRIASIRNRYSRIRASVASETHEDRRTNQRLLSKYGRREKNRTSQALHVVSKKIVQDAKEKRQAIVLERLKGIRFAHNRGNGEGRKLRGRLSRWSFHQIQGQIEYKAAWEGVGVQYVAPQNTSKTCSHCGSVNETLRYEREWTCSTCGTTLDRDLNAARNIVARSRLHEAALVQRSDEGLAREGMVLREATTRS